MCICIILCIDPLRRDWLIGQLHESAGDGNYQLFVKLLYDLCILYIELMFMITLLASEGNSAPFQHIHSGISHSIHIHARKHVCSYTRRRT